MPYYERRWETFDSLLPDRQRLSYFLRCAWWYCLLETSHFAIRPQDIIEARDIINITLRPRHDDAHAMRPLIQRSASRTCAHASPLRFTRPHVRKWFREHDCLSPYFSMMPSDSAAELYDMPHSRPPRIKFTGHAKPVKNAIDGCIDAPFSRYG